MTVDLLVYLCDDNILRIICTSSSRGLKRLIAPLKIVELSDKHSVQISTEVVSRTDQIELGYLEIFKFQ